MPLLRVIKDWITWAALEKVMTLNQHNFVICLLQSKIIQYLESVLFEVYMNRLNIKKLVLFNSDMLLKTRTRRTFKPSGGVQNI